jgi:hypothetical protein
MNLSNQLNGQFISKEKRLSLYIVSHLHRTYSINHCFSIWTNVRVTHLPLNLDKCPAHLRWKNKQSIYGSGHYWSVFIANSHYIRAQFSAFTAPGSLLVKGKDFD